MEAVVMGSVVLVAVFAYLFCIMPRVFHRPDISPLRNSRFAHRGLHDGGLIRPENSIPAFWEAIEQGYAIELDVQRTKDNKVVVFHDFDLNRICGVDKKVCNLTYEELKQYPLLKSNERIPLLSEVLKLVDKKVPILVELKYNAMNRDIAALTYKILRNYKGSYYIQCFHMKPLRWYKKKQPTILRGQLAQGTKKKGKSIIRIGSFFLEYLMGNFISRPDFISYSWKRQNNISLNLCKRLFGCPILAWTIRSEEELEKVRDRFDGIIFEGIDRSNVFKSVNHF